MSLQGWNEKVLIVKMAFFSTCFGKFFDHMYSYVLKIYQNIYAKTAHFSNQSKFRKKSIAGEDTMPAKIMLTRESPTLEKEVLGSSP